jgi:hypothetical protein
MSKAVSFASLLLAMALPSCMATSSGATDGVFSGGFSAYPVGEDGFYASFRGNSFTTPETIQAYWLYNCAVLTLSRGYDGFEVASASVKVSTTGAADYASTYPGPVVGALPYAANWIAATLVSGSALYDNIRVIRKPIAADPPKVFDAAIVKAALEPYVMGKKCNGGNICPHPQDYLKPGAAPAGM